MKSLIKTVAVVFFSIHFIACKNDSKEKQTVDKPVVSKHSSAFNNSVEMILMNYYSLSEAFVNWDTSRINTYSNSLKIALDSIDMDELLTDSIVHSAAFESLSNARVEIGSIIADPSLEEKRASFNLLSDNLKNLLITIKYNKQKIYWQECPMAFDDTKPGYWLSPVDSIRNPYLGTKHPKYHSGMLECGGTKEVIDFTGKDSTAK